MSHLANFVIEQFNPNHNLDLDCTVALNCAGNQVCQIELGQKTADTDKTESSQIKATQTIRLISEIGNAHSQPTGKYDFELYFRDEQMACDILAGRKNPIEAFCQGHYKSSGFLMWSFQILQIFRPTER